MKARSIFQHVEQFISRNGEIPEWEPFGPAKSPSSDMPGTRERVAIYRARLETGREMTDERDRNTYGSLE